MSLPDFQMARDHSDMGYNLAVGEPFYLQDTFKGFQAVSYNRGMTYPLTNGQPWLLDALKQFYPGEHIIVTNGAKYALQAAMYALKQATGANNVVHRTPYWPSYPTLAKLSGMTFNHVDADARNIVINTSPNNPDGSESAEKCDIWDAAYHSRQLYKCEINPEYKISVCSASKSFGFSGLRVGWACTKDPKLAELMSMFMEITTSGVSVASQGHLASLLELQLSEKGAQVQLGLQLARQKLETNGALFRAYVSPLCDEVQGVPKNGKGMFAWFKASRPEWFEEAMSKIGLKLVTGEACGMTEKGWYRMSMGHRNDVTEEALSKLAGAYPFP